MRRYDLPFEAVEAAELEEVKGDLLQVLYSLNLKDIAADLTRGSSPDLFYKVSPHSSLIRHCSADMQDIEAFM